MKPGAKQPRWGDAEQMFILCTITSERYGEVAFNAMPTDPEPAGRELHQTADRLGKAAGRR